MARSAYAAKLGDLLMLVEPRLPNELADPRSLQRIRSLAASLPASVATFFGFERRLGGSSGLDFALSLSSYGIDWLVSSDRWPELTHLLEPWLQQNLSGSVAAWLEFDTSERRENDTPNLFIAYERSVWDRIEATPAVRSCIEVCPATVTRLLLGFMCSRGTDAVKICAVPMSCAQAIAFLHDVRWSGDLNRVAAGVAPYAPLTDGICVQIDLCAGAEPSAGFELLYNGRERDWQYPREQRWLALFDRLIADGLCLEDERDALLRWASRETLEAPLIDRLIAAASPRGEVALYGTLYTGLQHIKLALRGNGVMQAKVYFGALLDSND